MKKSLFKILIIITIILIGSTSCNNENIKKEIGLKETIELNGKDVLKVNIDGEPLDINPITSIDDNSKIIINNIHEGLFYKKDGEIINGLVDTWELLEDGVTYIFHLKQTKWSDGKAFTATDVKRSWISVLKSETASRESFKLYEIYNAKNYAENIINNTELIGINVINEKTLSVRLNESSENFLEDLTQLVFYPYRDENTVLGPYKIESWIHHQQIILIPNPYYWDAEKVNFKKVIISMMTGNIKPVNEFAKGNLNISMINRQELYRYENQPELKTVINDSVYVLVFNFAGEAGKQKEFRYNIQQKFPYEIFRNKIINNKSPAVKSFNPYNLDQEIYKQTNFDKNKKSKNKKIKFLYKNSDIQSKVAPIIEQLAHQLGYDVDVKMMPENVYFKSLTTKAFDIALVRLKSESIGTWGYIESFSSQSMNNYYNLADHRIDRLYNTGKEQNALEAEKIIKEEVYSIPICYGMNYFLIDSKLKNIEFINQGVLYFSKTKY